MVLAAVLQLFAALTASTLAFLDDARVSAAGFMLGSAIGLAFILLRVRAAGIEAVAWEWRSTLRSRCPCRSRSSRIAPGRRRCPPEPSDRRGSPSALASRRWDAESPCRWPCRGSTSSAYRWPDAKGWAGSTSFGYAYLITAAVVAVTASSLGLVTSVPLTRTGIDPAATARHVVASAWPAVIAIGAAVGVFGLAGGQIVHGLFGSSYGADVGSDLGRLVVVFAPFAFASAGISVTYPLLFVAGTGRRLPLLAAAAVSVHIPLAILGQVLAGPHGLALALGAHDGVDSRRSPCRSARDVRNGVRSRRRRGHGRRARRRGVRPRVAHSRGGVRRGARPGALLRTARVCSTAAVAFRVALFACPCMTPKL